MQHSDERGVSSSLGVGECILQVLSLPLLCGGTVVGDIAEVSETVVCIVFVGSVDVEWFEHFVFGLFVREIRLG